MKTKLYCDGGARGNPGPGAYAFALYEGNKRLHLEAKRLGRVTNNIAEYNAILRGLSYALAIDRRDVVVFSDSQLAIRQLRGEYEVKDEKLKRYYLDVQNVERAMDSVSYQHVLRDNPRIRIVDRRLNQELDKLAGGQ